MPNETIADILSEIVVQKYQTSFSAADVIAWRDRIEAAAKRNRCGCDDSCEQFRDLESENDRLRAALAPVLACNTLSAEGSMPNYSGCLDAVRRCVMDETRYCVNCGVCKEANK